jgi:hypothetical protein
MINQKFMKLCTLQDPNMILQSSHIMILNSTKFGGNRTKDLEVSPDRQTERKKQFDPVTLTINRVPDSLKDIFSCHKFFSL